MTKHSPTVKHTPTPWVVIETDTSWHIKGPGDFYVARVGKGRDGVYDASLICQAVNAFQTLVDAVKSAVERENAYMGDADQEFIKEMKAALKKAGV